MRKLPSGTVTLLFTDVESSTKLLHELGAIAYARALTAHRRILREAARGHGGLEVNTQGDSFLMAFARATDAVAAAAEAQEALAAGRIRVRMGLHTGTPLVRDDDYVGIEVHRGARIAAAAHGGQVILSRETRKLLGERFPIRDLGEHRIKDFAEPVWIFQLGDQVFPPLLESCPNLGVLVTRRERLRGRGEVEYGVLPLAEPEAIDLFCQRARVDPNASVAALCRVLDNLPLALELAAARAPVLSPRQILERVSQRLDLLKGGRDAEARQRTLRATIEWSHDLLSAQEQRLFAALSVFAGGCTIEAAEAVANADLDALQGLVDKSLVRRREERFWMLETIREFAGERLEQSGEADGVRRRHAHHFLGFAEEAQTLHQALGEAWGIAHSGFLLGIVANEADFAKARSTLEEAVRRFRDLGDQHYTSLATMHLAWSYEELGDLERGRALHEENLRISRDSGNKRTEAMSLEALSWHARKAGRMEESLSQLHQAFQIIRDLPDRVWIANIVSRFAATLAVGHRPEAAAQMLAKSTALYEEIGSSPPPYVHRRNEQTLTQIHAGLDAEAFAEAWARGRALTLEAALDIAAWSESDHAGHEALD